MKKIITLAAVVLLLALAGAVFYAKRSLKRSEAALVVDKTEDVKGLGYAGQRKVAISKDGTIFMAYRKKYRTKYEIFVAKAAPSKSGWKISAADKPISVVGSGVDQRVPSLAIDSSNVIHVVWYGSDSSDESDNRQIKYASSGDGGKIWSSWKNISVVDGYAGEDYWQEHPHILDGTDGMLYVVWEGKDADNKNQQIKLSRSADGGKTWSSWKNIQTTKNNTQSRPTLVQDKNKRLHLFTYSAFGNDSGLQQIQYSWSDDQGGSWSPWQAVSDAASDSRHVSAAADPAGSVALVWRAQDSAGHAQIMYRSLAGGNWSEIVPVHQSEKQQFFPSLSVGPNGNTYVAWMESADTSGLPSEDPKDGMIYMAQVAPGKISEPKVIGSGTGNLYPNLPEVFGKSGLPLLYEAQEAFGQKFSLMFRLNQF